MEFYKVLQQIMNSRDLSIPEIARLTGLSDGTLRSALVRQQKNVALDVAFKLSHGLGVSLEYLNTGVLPSSTAALPSSLAPDESVLLQQYRAIPPDAQSRIRNSLHYEYQQYTGDASKENNSISTKIG
jgi:transcriptional regulator with XRE-family HTH domain